MRVGVSPCILNRKHVDVLSHLDLSCHGTWMRPPRLLQSQRGSARIIYICVYYTWSCHATRNSIKTPLYPRGLSHLNSDKPFWTRRYYTVQENPGSITAVPPSLIIYPGPRRDLDELTSTAPATAKTCRCHRSKASES